MIEMNMSGSFVNGNDSRMCFTVKIAGIPICIEARYSYVYSCCSNYLTTDEPMFSVHATQKEIQDEVSKNKHYYYFYKGFTKGEKTNNETTKEINEGIIESAIIHRKIAEKFPAYNAIFMHGAVIAIGNSSYMFSARSGTGKTTHIKKWIENAEKSYVVNGDKPFILVNQKGAFSCGTPWCGKENYGRNCIVPLRSIVFMERCTENQIEPVSFQSIYMKLLEQTYQPSDVNHMKCTLEILSKLKELVSFYRFRFDNLKNDAFRTSYDCLTKQTTK